MAPKCVRKRGRPKGSTNKKTYNENVKSEQETYEHSCDDATPEFSCEICNRRYDSEELLRKHKAKCKPIHKLDVQRILYSCDDCNKKFKFKASLLNHQKNEHSKLPNAICCCKCKAKCPNKQALKNHVEKVHSGKKFSCPQCNKKFVRHAHVLRHMFQSGCDGRNVPSYYCKICNAKFSRRDNLQVHLRVQHILKNGFDCKYCSYFTKNFSKLIRHWQDKHLYPPKFECDFCGRTTSSRAAITKHLEIHGEKTQDCYVCGYRTYTVEVLRRHMLTHTDEKPYKCSLCGASYIQRSQLTRHLEKHTGNMCVECGETFSSKVKLIIHQREHKGLDQLVCPFEDCAFAKKLFGSEQSLHAHVKSHLEKKTFPCEVCGKRFHAELNMRRHVGTHRLDRPRRCMYCVNARAYIRGEQLLRHVRMQHPAIFRQHLEHVRQVLGVNVGVERVKKSELESILNVLDAESERIIEGYGDKGVLYGGIQEQDAESSILGNIDIKVQTKTEQGPLMSEEELEENLRTLLSRLIDQDTLECFGWPDESVDVLLEKVIEHCGAHAADRDKWTRVQCLRENTKHLFLYAVEDENIARMLDTHTIDQIVKHIIMQVSDEDCDKKPKC